MRHFERIFSPIQVGTMTVPNRIVATTYSINSGRADGLPDRPFIDHHLEKAKGGVGWIGGETWILPTPLPPGRADELLPGAAAVRHTAFDHPDFVPRVRAFLDAVHDTGAVGVMQLTHLQSTMCPSAVQAALIQDRIPHVLENDEIERMIDAYPRAAVLCRDAGADAVELHCAHDTTPQLFLSPLTNRREDRWGGSLDNRIRFVSEAVRRIRDAVGRSINVGLRLCADERCEGGYTLEDMKAMARRIADDAHIDFLNVDVGNSWGYPSYIQPAHYGPAPFADCAGAIRKAVNEGRKEPIPVIYAGRVTGPDVAEKILAAGLADLVGMTRASIADPEFPRKAREGRLHNIRPCIGCNTCIGQVIHAEVKTAVCAVNPSVGNEATRRKVTPAQAKKRVVVIGGGPAGLETARTAASRGHRVILLEKQDVLGGQLRISSRAPGRERFLELAHWHERELERLEVEVRLGVAASSEEVLALSPDAVVVATGSVPRVPEDVPGVEQPGVVQAWDVLAGKAACGKRVVVLSEDDHMETPSVADLLSAAGHEVTILQKWGTIASAVERYTTGIVLRRLYSQGVDIRPSTRVRRIEGSAVVAYNTHSGREEAFRKIDTVVLSVRSRAEDRLYRELRGRAPESYLVGSAFAPRLIHDATRHGANVAALL